MTNSLLDSLRRQQDSTVSHRIWGYPEILEHSENPTIIKQTTVSQESSEPGSSHPDNLSFRSRLVAPSIKSILQPISGIFQ
jgi:hypothetical protein